MAEAISWITPRSFFPKESQAAFDKYDRCSGRLVSFTERELSDLWSHPGFEEAIKAEKSRRQDAADAALEARRQTPTPSRRPATPAPVLTEELADRLIDALLKAFKSNDTADLDDVVTKNPRLKINLDMLATLVLKPLSSMCASNRTRNTRLDAIEARLNGLEQSPGKAAGPAVRYSGVWTGTQAYDEGMLVTHRGGLWLAKQRSLCQRPGIVPDAWTLVVKSGQAE